jgi:hypothetical protein
MRVLEQVHPSIIQVPLTSNKFNRSKSNIAWIEGTVAGACTLGPSWDEWKKPGLIDYIDKQNYYEHLSNLVKKDDEYRIHLNNQSWNYIQENLTLGTVNEMRWKILQDKFGF